MPVDIQSLLNTYGLTNDPTLTQTLAPATKALEELTRRRQGRVNEEEMLMGMGRSGQREARVDDLEALLQEQTSDMYYKAASARAERQYQEEQVRMERERQEKALKEKEDRDKEMGLWKTIGTGVGAIGGALATPVLGPAGFALGAQAGGELGGGIAGLKYGAQPSFSGIGDIGGVLSQRDAQQKNFDIQKSYLDKYLEIIERGGTPWTAPGNGTGK
jgi:hypothetical protein